MRYIALKVKSLLVKDWSFQKIQTEMSVNECCWTYRQKST